MASTIPNLWRRWVVAFTLGELVGFGGLPVVLGSVTFALTAELSTSMRSLLLYVVAIVAGFGEGIVLGWFQLRVLRDCLPRINARRWLIATGTAAAFAWACGMLAPTLDDLIGLPPVIQIAIWIPAGVLILLSIGLAQGYVLRGVVARPRRWIVANVLGWIAGLPWTFVLPALLPDDSPGYVWIATFAIAGTLMGATAGSVTGVALQRLQLDAGQPQAAHPRL